MGTKVPVFSSGTVEKVAKLIGEVYSGRQITSLLLDVKCGRFDPGEGITKWKRIDEAISRQQVAQGDGRPLLAVACKAVEPGRLMSAEYPEAAEHLHEELDTVLSIEAYGLTDDGRARKLARKATFEEARNKALSLREHLQKRGSHEEVLKHCREELLQDVSDYYELVFEAAKGLEDRIRLLSNSTLDGRNLPQNVLGSKNRTVPINSGATKTQRNEQDAVALFVEGVIAGFRNPQAHETRLRWTVTREDAQDVLGLLALIHRRLDTAEDILRGGGADTLS